MNTEAPKDKDTQQTTKSKWGKWLGIVLIVILLGAVGLLGWWLKNCRETDKTTDRQKQQLQSQVDTLKKQLDDAKKAAVASSPSTTPTTPAPTCSAVSQSLKDNIKDAISSKNTAALQGYMTSSVKLVIAASEKGSTESAAQAVTDLDYLNNNATAPWDFALTAATTNAYKAGFYGAYFADGTFVGKANNGYVVSFGFTCGKISTVFMAASPDLLT
ncbi:MAG TPA: hypothetical protein VLF60_00670 [Candidatus Saccharimonadales bacterium]|nr:hypothetical protein [Candidatus Saccharimonadales bacterium]